MELQSLRKIRIPEWYLLERETEKTISKLSSIKDLSFYLKHQDEAIRRMAILRINVLKLREAIDILSEIMDDPLESVSNKELAAWTIKAVSIKWDVDLYVSSRLLSKYTGYEKLNGLFKVEITDNKQQLTYNFPSYLEASGIEWNDSDMRINDEISLDMSFSPAEWLKCWSSSTAAIFKKGLCSLPEKITGWFTITLKNFSKTLYSIRSKGFIISPDNKSIRPDAGKKSAATGTPALSKGNKPSAYVRFSLRHRVKHMFIRAGRVAGKFIFNLAYFIFTPVRVIVKHRKIALVLLFTAYLAGTYTDPGKYLVYKYFRTDLLETQTYAYYTSKEILTYAWDEFKEIAGLTEHNFKSVYGTGNSLIK